MVFDLEELLLGHQNYGLGLGELLFDIEELLILQEKYYPSGLFFYEQPPDYESQAISLYLSCSYYPDYGFYQNLV